MIAANSGQHDDEGRNEVVGENDAVSHSQSPLVSQPGTVDSGRVEPFTHDTKGLGRAHNYLRRGFRLTRRLRHKAVEAAEACLDSADTEIRMKALQVVVQMERVNVSIDKEPPKHLHLHGSSPVIQVVHVDDWYGSKAANLAAANAASATHPPLG